MKRQTTVTITPGSAHGRVVIPPSKSIAHRALICAALAQPGQESRLGGMPYNEDIDATMDCLRALGVTMTEHREPSGDTRQVIVRGCGGRWGQDNVPLCCRESGSTLRFMLPLCLLSEQERTLLGSERLLARPLDDYHSLLCHRVWSRVEGGVHVGNGATLSGTTYRLSGKSSSQFITGLLFVLPLLAGDSRIVLPEPPESRSYIDMTLAVLARFGVRAAWQDATHLFVPGNQTYAGADMQIDGDASGAAFFWALRALQRERDLPDVVCSSSDDIVQGDAVCASLLGRLAQAERSGPPVISLADCPDLGPILFAVAAALGGAVFTHTDRLRLKESDRVSAMIEELGAFGARFEVQDGVNGGTVTVLSPEQGLHAPARVLHGHNDHRVVMSLAVLAACMEDDTPVQINDAQAVAKSFPDFFDRLRALGVGVSVFE